MLGFFLWITFVYHERRGLPFVPHLRLEKPWISCTVFPARGPFGEFTELSEELRLSRSHVHQLLKSLEEKGFARKDPVGHKYRLDFKLLELGDIVAHTSDIRSVALPFMHRLQGKVGGTVSLGILDNDELLILDRVEPSDLLRVAFPVGTRLPCNHGACGKLLLAFMDGEEREDLLRRRPLGKLTEKTITDPKKLEVELDRIRVTTQVGS